LNNSKDKSLNVPACVVIPFFNESGSIRNVVEKTLKHVNSVIAVNDGSTDGSEKTIEDIPEVILVNHKENFGKGMALKTGFGKAINLNYNYVITIDADGQHDPEYIPYFINALNNFDIVIGNRLNDLSSMPFQRRLSNKITSFLLSRKTDQEIKDSQCGFRAYRIEVLKNVQTNFHGFEAESEIIVKAARKRFKIGFVNIPTIYAGEKSKMTPFAAISGFIKVLFL